MASSPNFMVAIDKLDGRDNYNTWKFAVKAYLSHEGLWKCVLGTELDEDKNIKATSKLILLVKPTNYVHIQSCTTAKEIWDKLNQAFADSGLTRRVNLIRQLTSTRLENCLNIEAYVNEIMTAAHKLADIGGDNVSDEWIGIFLLAGLRVFYKPMIMAIESSGIQITSDLVKTKLLQEVKSSDDIRLRESNALYSSKHQSTNNRNIRGPRCFRCNEFGNISVNCDRPFQELKSDSNTTRYGAGMSGNSNNSASRNKKVSYATVYLAFSSDPKAFDKSPCKKISENKSPFTKNSEQARIKDRCIDAVYLDEIFTLDQNLNLVGDSNRDSRKKNSNSEGTGAVSNHMSTQEQSNFLDDFPDYNDDEDNCEDFHDDSVGDINSGF